MAKHHFFLLVIAIAMLVVGIFLLNTGVPVHGPGGFLAEIGVIVAEESSSTAGSPVVSEVSEDYGRLFHIIGFLLTLLAIIQIITVVLHLIFPKRR